MTEKNGGNSTSGVQWVDFMLSCTTQAVFYAKEKNETFYITNKINKHGFIYTSLITN